MKKYEVMYIIRPDIEEEAQTTLIERFNKILTDNGADIEKVDEMGKRRLAYEIKNYRDEIAVSKYSPSLVGPAFPNTFPDELMECGAFYALVYGC